MSIKGKPGPRILRVLIIVALWGASLAEQVGAQPPPTVPLGRPGGEPLELPAYEETEKQLKALETPTVRPKEEQLKLPPKQPLRSPFPPSKLPLGRPGDERLELPTY
jgi:hypothetical protein